MNKKKSDYLDRQRTHQRRAEKLFKKTPGSEALFSASVSEFSLVSFYGGADTRNNYFIIEIIEVTRADAARKGRPI